MDFISILSIFVLACFVGYYVVWSVTPALHTPLMAVTNAISSVIIVGALIAAAASGDMDFISILSIFEGRRPSKWLGLSRVVLASVNIFGGFAVTRAHAGHVQEERQEAGGFEVRHVQGKENHGTRSRRHPGLGALAYLVAGVLFILALRGLSSPETSQRGQPQWHDRHADRGGHHAGAH
jgi:H+-translocating NAD(P) transhydrogenase subunit alpha